MTIKRLVIFGDSLQDNGNLIKTLKIPGKPYYGGRFSNGKVACEYLQKIIAEKESCITEKENCIAEKEKCILEKENCILEKEKLINESVSYA